MTDGIGLRADFTGAIRKMETLKALPRAHKYQATSWTAETIRLLMRSAAQMQKSAKYKKKSSLMGRNIGQLIAAGDERWTIAIGTGIGGKQSVPYAKIQDEGGTTHPNVTDRMRKWAWWAFYKFREERFKWLALTKQSQLTVNVPASRWFSGVIEEQKPILSAMMQKNVVLKVAEIMGSGAVGIRSEIN
jgi:hypothetical protein